MFLFYFNIENHLVQLSWEKGNAHSLFVNCFPLQKPSFEVTYS